MLTCVQKSRRSSSESFPTDRAPVRGEHHRQKKTALIFTHIFIFNPSIPFSVNVRVIPRLQRKSKHHRQTLKSDYLQAQTVLSAAAALQTKVTLPEVSAFTGHRRLH